MITYKAVPLTGVSSVVQLITVTALFILVLILTYLTTRFIGGYQKGKLSTTNIKVLESIRLSNNKIIELVKIGDKVFAISVCKDTVTLLGEINEESLETTETSENIQSFDAILKKFRHGR